MAGKSGRVPPWDYKFTGDGATCLVCGVAQRTAIVRMPDPADPGVVPAKPEPAAIDSTSTVVATTSAPPEVGVCEACVIHMYWAWRGIVPDADQAGPDESLGEVERVKVVVSALRVLPGDKRADPEHPDSYQVALVVRPDGGLDLPSADLRPRDTCAAAAARALAQHGVLTWDCFVEPLYAALSPRGRLSRVMLATAYTTWERDPLGGVRAAPAPAGKLQWRDGPPWEEAHGLRALYLGLRDVWPLRVWKYVARDPRPSQVTTIVRRAAAEYIYMQQDLRSGVPGVDTSAAELLRRGMSEDEKMVEKLLGTEERGLAEVLEQEQEQGAKENIMIGSEAVAVPMGAQPSLASDAELDEPPGDLDEGGADDPLADEFKGNP